MNGVSKKLTVAGVGIAALLTLGKTEASDLATLVASGIIGITLVAIAAQTFLDYISKKEVNGGQ